MYFLIVYTFMLLLPLFLNRDKNFKTGEMNMKYIKGSKQVLASNEKKNISRVKSLLQLRNDHL